MGRIIRFFKFLSFGRNVIDDPQSEQEFCEARGFNGLARHITKGRGDKGLCETVIMDQWVKITREELIEALPKQHEGYFYCVNCTSEFTGLSEEEAIEQRRIAFA